MYQFIGKSIRWHLYPQSFIAFVIFLTTDSVEKNTSKSYHFEKIVCYVIMTIQLMYIK